MDKAGDRTFIGMAEYIVTEDELIDMHQVMTQ